VALEHGAHSIDLTGTNVISNVQAIGEAAWEEVDLGDIGTPGEAAFKNLDETNYLELALDDAGANKFAKLRPGRSAIIPLTSPTLYAKANTAACDLLVVAAEE
jgi:hypothetical protein